MARSPDTTHCEHCESPDEIVVTPEMIEAGAKEARTYDPRYEGPADIAGAIYVAMEQARRVNPA